MSAKVLVLYNPPADPAAFNKYYFETHVPLAKRIPGLRSYTVSEGPINALSGTSPFLVAELYFDNIDAVGAALGSPEGQATAADLGNFATGGATILIMQTKEV